MICLSCYMKRLKDKNFPPCEQCVIDANTTPIKRARESIRSSIQASQIDADEIMEDF